MTDERFLANTIIAGAVVFFVVGAGVVACQIDQNHQATEQARILGKCVDMGGMDATRCWALEKGK